MLTFPRKFISEYNQDYHDREHEETKDHMLHSVALLESIRSELGDTAFSKIIKYRDLVLECLNRTEYLRDNGRYDVEHTSKNWGLHSRLNEPLDSRLQQFGQHLTKEAKKVIDKVIGVRGYKECIVTRCLKGPYTINATCDVQGWGNNHTTCYATIPKDWHKTPAKEVCAAFKHKFFALQCRHEPEHSTANIQMYWVNRAMRTTKVGFKEPEVGYAAVNDNNFVGWGTTPELALKSLNKDIAKAAKARLLATLKA